MLHDTVRHVYEASLKLFGIQVLTDDGFRDVVSVNKTEKQKQFSVKTETRRLVCSGKHVLITGENGEICAEDSLGAEIRTIDGKRQKIVEVAELRDEDNLFDLSLADDSSHRYYCDGLLSHNCVICDEFAFLQKNLADKLFTSMFPVISSSKNGKFIIVSTPNGTNNLYYDIWQKANSKEKNKNLDGWKPFTMWWWQVPGHDEAWKAKQIEAIGAQRFAQEFNNEFLASSTTKKLVPDDIIEKYRIRLSELNAKGFKPKECRILAETEDKVFKFLMWKEFRKDRVYLASGDISEGVGGDDSVLYVWDVTDLSNVEMCAKFSSNSVSLVEFAYVCSKILALYGNPPFFAERNGVSAGTLDSLRITYKYDNVPVENKKGEPGIYSHVTVKTAAEMWAREMLTTDGFGFAVYDKELIDEMGTFVKKDNKGVHTLYQAATGAHDDKMMSFVWACWGLSKDLIDKYFVVCENFVSSFGKIYPKILAPQKPYDAETLNAISKDPIYLDFVETMKNAYVESENMKTAFEAEDSRDDFKYEKFDPYFGGPLVEPSWNSPRSFSPGNDERNPDNRFPVFFVM